MWITRTNTRLYSAFNPEPGPGAEREEMCGGWEARLRYCACLGRHVSDDSLKVKVRVGHFYKEKKLINCSTLKSERSHKCKINLQLVKDSNIKR